MNTVLSKLKLIYKKIRGLLPSPLPQGVTEFEAWCLDIQATYTLPTESKDDIHFCFASAIIRFGETTWSKPKYHFVKALRAGAAKQIAGNAFTEIKIRQKAAYEAAQKAEATALPAIAYASEK